MATVEGIHSQGAKGRQIRYRVEYEVVGAVVNYRACFDAGKPAEGQFDFDPAKVGAAEAVDAFMRNLIEKSDWDRLP